MSHLQLTSRQKNGTIIIGRSKSLKWNENFKQTKSIKVARKHPITNNERLGGGADNDVINNENNEEEELIEENAEEQNNSPTGQIIVKAESKEDVEILDKESIEEESVEKVEKDLSRQVEEYSDLRKEEAEETTTEQEHLELETTTPIRETVVESSVKIYELEVFESTGDKKVDEIIENVRRNILEAHKVLATLGENFEHETKLMFVEILGRIQRWIGIMKKQLDACIIDLETLHKQLLLRISEGLDKEVEINKLKNLLDSTKVNDKTGFKPIQGDETKIFNENESRSGSKPIRGDETRTFNENARKSGSKLVEGDEAKTLKENERKSGSKPIKGDDTKTFNEDARKSGSKIVEGDETKTFNENERRSDSKSFDEHGTKAFNENEDKLKDHTALISSENRFEDDFDNRSQEYSPGMQMKTESNATIDPKRGDSRISFNSEIYPRTSRDKMNGRIGQDDSQHHAAHAVGPEREREREWLRREVELESEINKLKEENERIIQERADYENAIQRALLRGVSSLNVEALRVLRCPPIPCCTPCTPYPGTANISQPRESYQSRGTRSSKNGATSESIKVMVPRRDNYFGDYNDPGTPCCPTSKTRKSSDKGLVFLLRQNETKGICSNNPSTSTAFPSCTPVVKRVEMPPCPRLYHR